MEVHESIWEVPLPSSPKVCSKAAELQSDPPSWELAQTLMQKASNAFCPAHVPHPTLATWTALYFAHSFPEPQEQHSSLEWKTHSRIFFSSWQSCLFPAVVKSDFSSDCPSAADIYLIWGRKRTSFFSSLLPYGEKLVGFAAGLSPREGFQGWQDRLYKDQKADSGIANRITHKGEGKTAALKWEQALTWSLLVGEERSWWCFVF